MHGVFKRYHQPRSWSSSAILDVTSPVKLVGNNNFEGASRFFVHFVYVSLNLDMVVRNSAPDELFVFDKLKELR